MSECCSIVPADAGHPRTDVRQSWPKPYTL
jgi:hypothetical protein